MGEKKPVSNASQDCTDGSCYTQAPGKLLVLSEYIQFRFRRWNGAVHRRGIHRRAWHLPLGSLLLLGVQQVYSTSERERARRSMHWCMCAVAQLNAQGAGKGALMFSAPCLHFIPAFSALTTTHALCFSFADACHEVTATYLILIARLWISLIRGQNKKACSIGVVSLFYWSHLSQLTKQLICWWNGSTNSWQEQDC